MNFENPEETALNGIYAFRRFLSDIGMPINFEQLGAKEEDIPVLIEKFGIGDGETGGWHHLHGYRHPNYACLNAKELYPLLSEKEEKIIRRHMWPLTLMPPGSKEGFVVTFADKYCATIEVYYSLNKKYREKFINKIEEL